MTTKILNGDCLELMKDLPDKSVDLVICDLPYGETNCNWDSKIDLVKFWEEFKRIRKSKRTCCIHFCSTKFGYTLIKSNEKMFKMDMVWKKRNKTGGLQSRHRPMRNHEMVYFFYEQAPKYNRDKYHKRIKAEPDKKNKTIKANDRKAMGESSGIYSKENQTASSFVPPNPSSVVEEKPHVNIHGLDKSHPTWGQHNSFVPPNPASVVEEKEETIWGEKKKDRHKRYLQDGTGEFKPPNPASVVEEKFCKEYYDTNKTGMTKTDIYSKEQIKKYHKENGVGFEPPNPASVVEEPAEDEPVSMFESTKVFTGKRFHQTQKPQDILDFFLKYWADPGDTVLDPTMGSGSTGVACKNLGINFIGFEMNEEIFKTAQKRLDMTTKQIDFSSK